MTGARRRPPEVLPKPDRHTRETGSPLRRQTDVANRRDGETMQAYLDLEYGLVEQVRRRNATHGFFGFFVLKQ